MPFPSTKTELGVEAKEEILRSNNVCEVLLADDVVYGKAVDSLKYARKDERFHALMKFESAEYGTEQAPMPSINVRYELWRLDKDKLEEYMKRTIGVCAHTMKAYSELEDVGIVSNVEDREWRHYSDSQKMSELHRCEANGVQIFGFCETCEAQWRAKGGLPMNLLKRFVNEKLYIHPFIRSRKDELDELVVTEDVQLDYARFRLVHELAHFIVGNEKALVQEVARCYELKGPFFKENYRLSSYGVLDAAMLNKLQNERFKNFVLFDTSDRIHQNKKRSKDIDISSVEHRRLKTWGVREDLHAFEVKYSRLRQRRGVEKLAALTRLRVGGYTEDEVELFCVGASDEGVAKRWRETISSEIPTKLEPQFEFQSNVKLLDSLIASVRKDDKVALDPITHFMYPSVEASKGDAGEEFEYKWDKVLDISEKDDEAAYLCLSNSQFPCNVRDARWIVAGMRNYWINLDRRENDDYDFDSVELDNYEGYETRMPVFEQEIFGNSLIALDVNFGPPGEKRPYGVVKQTSLVTARVRSQYEPGFPLLPYALVPTFGKYEASAKRVADAVYSFGHRWFGSAHNNTVPTYWDRWFAVKKGFWTEKGKTEGRDGVRATWCHTGRSDEDKMVESRKTWLEEARVANFGFMYLKVDDTTTFKDGIPHSKIVRHLAITKLDAACTPIARASDAMIEAKTLSLANIGYNTQHWDIRSTVMDRLLRMIANLSTSGREDTTRCIAMVCQGVDKLLLGVRAQVMTIAAMDWALTFFRTVLELTKSLKNYGSVVEEWLQTWRMFFSIIEKVEVPSAMKAADREKYHNRKAAFVQLAQSIGAPGFNTPTVQSVLPGPELLDVIVPNIIREKSSKNTTIENRLHSTDALTVNDVIKVGILASQVEDYSAEISLLMKTNMDNWTCLPDLDISKDKVTMKMLRRSLQCLRTPLAGQFLYQLQRAPTHDDED